MYTLRNTGGDQYSAAAAPILMVFRRRASVRSAASTLGRDYHFTGDSLLQRGKD